MDKKKKSLVYIHMAVFLLGMPALFGKLINLPAVIIVLGRVVFSSLFLILVIKVRKLSIKLETKQEYLLIICAGVMLAIHWTAFMQSSQTSTVAIATLTFSTYPLIVTFLEPYLFHEKLKRSSIICAIIMLTGVLCIVPKFELSNHMTQGVLWGMLSSLTFGIVSLINRRFSDRYASCIVSFYEQGTAALVLLPAFFMISPVITLKDLGGLLLLGVLFTGVAHTLFISGLKHIKVQTAGILSGLETVYGILFAFLLLREVPSVKELIGGVVILGTAFYSTFGESS